jgi:hypothetical protein
VNETSLGRAMRLRELGFSLFPVPRPRPGVAPGCPGDGKVPAIPWREFQELLPSVDELAHWFLGEPLNIAIVTGRISDLVVVDADSPEALHELTRRLPYTPWQVKTSKGFHAYYRHPGVQVRDRAKIDTGSGRLPLDVRGDGGYVIGPGSIHSSGVEYIEAGDWTQPRENVPTFWPGWIAKPKPVSRPSVTSAHKPTGDVILRARRYLAATPRPEIGHGSDEQTFTAACRLVRGFELSDADTTSLLWEWAGGRPGWTFEWIAQKVEHARRYGSEPLGAMR